MFLLNLSKNNFLFCIENYNNKRWFNKSIKQYGRILNIFRIISNLYNNTMSYEAGSKECINDGLNKHTVLLLRDDPII